MNVNRVYNFCAGPCTLPLEVLLEVQEEITEHGNSGMSIIEHSHRGKEYAEVHAEAVQDVRDLLSVPDDFSILFMQGGATLQFAMIAMNLLGDSDKAGYVNTGHWAKLAIKDAALYGSIYEAWSGAEGNFTTVPECSSDLDIQPDTRYLHITANETIGGLRIPYWPDAGVPLVADMSSDYLTREVAWDRFAVAYGGAQKNMGPAGAAMVVIRKSLLERAPRALPAYLDFKKQVASEAMSNTPSVFSIYVIGKVLKWVKRNGGISQMHQNAVQRSGILYDAIERSDGYYSCPVALNARSLMNVVFRLPSDELEARFLLQAESEGMMYLAGHRSVGGLRASIYNAMEIAGAQKLADFMESFRASNP